MASRLGMQICQAKRRREEKIGGEIKAAYRRLAREVHPDAGATGDEDFIRLHAAYATLADPDERARYDRAMAGPAASAFRRAPASSFRRRTWETDQCW